MQKTAVFRMTATLLLASGLAQLALGGRARGAEYVVFKIWNDTNVPITQLYDKDSRQAPWGIDDLQGHPIRPGHYFYIRMEQDSYAHCPGLLHDVRLVFANGAVKTLSKVEVCKYDVHVNKP
jgi:hypothetical protein